MDEIEELIEALDFAIEQNLTDIELEYDDCSELRIVFPNGKSLLIYEDDIKESDEDEDESFEL